MIALKNTFLFTFLLSTSVALGACSSDDSRSSPAEDTSPVSATNAAGLWKLHYEWEASPPPAWKLAFGSAQMGDLEVAVPSTSQKRGMFAAETEWGFAPMTSIAEGGKVTWTFNFTGPDGKAFTLDFAGVGTGSSLEGTATLSNDATTSATWTAAKVRDALIAPKSLAGDWTLDFQWARRTPGQLLVTCTDGGSCTIPAGQDGGPKQDDIAAVTLEDNRLTFKFPGATHTGVVTSSGVLWGYMDSADGNTGVWTAKRGKPAAEETERREGCTSNSECGSCKRCELSTGKCLTRLTC